MRKLSPHFRHVVTPGYSEQDRGTRMCGMSAPLPAPCQWTTTEPLLTVWSCSCLNDFQLQFESELTQLVSNAAPSASTCADPRGGMPFASRRLMRAINTERVAAPGAMSRALVMPRSPRPGTTSQAWVSASAVE